MNSSHWVNMGFCTQNSTQINAAPPKKRKARCAQGALPCFEHPGGAQLHKAQHPHGGQCQQHQHRPGPQDARDTAEVQHDHRATQHRQRQQGGERLDFRPVSHKRRTVKAKAQGRREDAAWEPPFVECLPLGEGGRKPDEGRSPRDNPYMGYRGTAAPHQSPSVTASPRGEKPFFTYKSYTPAPQSSAGTRALPLQTHTTRTGGR